MLDTCKTAQKVLLRQYDIMIETDASTRKIRLDGDNDVLLLIDANGLLQSPICCNSKIQGLSKVVSLAVEAPIFESPKLN
jgi:hypothetical protein